MSRAALFNSLLVDGFTPAVLNTCSTPALATMARAVAKFGERRARRYDDDPSGVRTDGWQDIPTNRPPENPDSERIRQFDDDEDNDRDEPRTGSMGDGGRDDGGRDQGPMGDEETPEDFQKWSATQRRAWKHMTYAERVRLKRMMGRGQKFGDGMRKCGTSLAEFAEAVVRSGQSIDGYLSNTGDSIDWPEKAPYPESLDRYSERDVGYLRRELGKCGVTYSDYLRYGRQQ